ncbi:MAG: hypothetical protein ACI9LX_003219 [Paraglaciecola sp.]|jgi:hypothetical protein
MNQYSQERFKRDYIFQLYAYLCFQELIVNPLWISSEGMRLNASVVEAFNERVKI